jgi:hypothetical protein
LVPIEETKMYSIKSVTICVCVERSGILPGYSLEELVGGELDGAVGEDADHLRPVPLVQRQEPLRTHHPHSQQCNSQLALYGRGGK